MNRLTILALSWFVATVIGCGNTYFNVRVRDRRPTGWIGGANVALRGDATCSSGPLSQEYTDDAGMALVEAPGCGPRVLWVSADGYRPVEQDVDSCDDAQRNIVLSERMPPEPQLNMPEVATARAFLGALDAQDRDAVAQMLADPSELPQYLDNIVPTRLHVCIKRFSRVLPGDETRVEFDSICDTGCRESWRIVLISDEGTLRVRALPLGSTSAAGSPKSGSP